MSIFGGTAAFPSRLRFNIPAIWILALAGAGIACIPLVYLIVRGAEADADTVSGLCKREDAFVSLLDLDQVLDIERTG